MSGRPQGGFSADTFDPAVAESDIGFFKALFRIHDVARETAIPCIVRSYDAEKCRASVQPLVNNVVRNVDGEKEIERPTYEDIPVMRICRGGFSVSMPLFAGDTGILLALDRNCASAIEHNSSALSKEQTDEDGDNKGPEKPDDMSTASFANGVFIPFSFSPSDDDKESITIKGLKDGSPSIVVSPKSVSVKVGESEVLVDGDKVSAKRGSDSVSLTDEGPKFSGKVDSTVRLVTGVRIDSEASKVFVRDVEACKRGTFFVSVGNENDWHESK
jgi:hypothetical protein